MTTRSFFASDAADFVATPTARIVGDLSTRVGLEHSGEEAQQIRAWSVQVETLKAGLHALGNVSLSWGVLIELPLLRLGRRIDTVLLVGDHIACLEFKIGASRFVSSDIDQAVDYALCLRDFHGASLGRRIIPILCADQAPREHFNPPLVFVDDVADCVKTNEVTLVDALRAVAAEAGPEQINWRTFDSATYNPTPDIVAAAKHVYAGHTVREIGRADASAAALEATAQRLRESVERAHSGGEHVICFVTGEPGSGKTLLGLDLVFTGEAGRVAGEPAALLSGNRPLVYVLQEAISMDARDRLGLKAREARRRSQQALQTLLGYLKDYANAETRPPENVIVFDEAQRAWDADTGQKLLGRPKSEPELFLEIMGRLPWACLICLVGPGQEINRGEGGLALWGQALADLGSIWTTYAADAALNGSGGVSGLLDDLAGRSFSIVRSPDLHLRTNLRAYRNAAHGQWVEALLSGDIVRAARIADTMTRPPAAVTRDLRALKVWLRHRRRGGQRVGLLASSGAVRLVAEGLPPSPRSNELDAVVHWFLKPTGDYRSSNALETPLSEFVCQGLEVDYVGLCWGNDLIWDAGGWIQRRMSAPNWQNSRTKESRQYRLNAYRVLLTRARAGLAIYIPRGDLDDPSRLPADFEEVYRTLLAAGCGEI